MAKIETDGSKQMLRLAAELIAKSGDLWSLASERSKSPGVNYIDKYIGEYLSKFSRAQFHTPGSKGSFVPPLGKSIWNASDDLSAKCPFSAQIYETNGVGRVGYVRIAGYTYNEELIDWLAKAIVVFERDTDCLVFDQVDNLGGSMFQMYAVLSLLSDRPLYPPRHEMRFTQDDLEIAEANLELVDATHLEDRPSPIVEAYSRFVVSEVKQGRGFGLCNTIPGYLAGIDRIVPARFPYTKKLIVLINGLTVSAPEFLAAILQDNQRAVIFGEKSLGAGGCTRTFSKVLSTGARLDFTLTWTVAWRPNGLAIENHGVSPDVAYELTAVDYSRGFEGYRKALLSTIRVAQNPYPLSEIDNLAFRVRYHDGPEP